MKKFTRDEMKEILLTTILAVGFLTIAVAAPNAVQLFKYFVPKDTRDKTKIKRSIARLENSKYIKKKLVAGVEQYILTETGRARAMRYQLFSMKIEEQLKWDGLWRIVMFDIPESKRTARLAINLALKKLGCVQYQKSVFITPYPCKKEIDFAASCFGVRGHIKIIIANEIENESTIKKVFKL